MDHDLASHLRKLRSAAGLTQEELADRAGISVRAVSDIERGLRKSIYKDTARRLADSLDLDHGKRDLFLGIARGRRPHLEEDESRGRVPAPPSLLIGRKRDLEALLDRVRNPDLRLVTITGPGGIGKTRLAVEAALLAEDEFPGGVFFVPLAAIPDPGLLFSAVARAMDIAPMERAPFDAVVERLRRARALVVLDTLEHITSAGEEIADFLSACSSVKVLATSREALRLRAEVEVALSPLELPDEVGEDLERYGASSLFLERARAVVPDLVPSSETGAMVADICKRVEGLPLAIELAAARLKHLTLEALRNHLNRSFGVLSGGSRDLPPRQRAMEEVVSWSYDLLDEEERSMLRALSIFAGGFSLEAVGAVCAGGDALAGLSALIDKSLVIPPRVEEGPARYRMLDTIREFAVARRDAAGETETLAEAHARYFLDLAEGAEGGLGGAAQDQWMRRLDADRDNLRSALRWAIGNGRAEVAQRVAGALWHYWRFGGQLAEGRGWLRDSLAIDDDADRPSRAKVYWGSAWLAFQAGDYEEAGRLSIEFLAFTRRSGEAIDTRNALTVRGMIAMAEGRFHEAVISFRESVDICELRGRNWLLATSFLNLGLGVAHAGDPRAAVDHLEEARQIYEELGDRHFSARARAYLSHLLTMNGDREGARVVALDALQEFRRLDDAPGSAEALEALAIVDSSVEPLLAAYEAGAAESIREGIAQKALPFDSRFLNECLNQARLEVDELSWDEAWERGRNDALSMVIEIAARAHALR